MYRYETHLHTYPVSKCAHATVEETLLFYKKLGLDGVFITNHFIDGNINMDKKTASFEELLEFYYTDEEEAKRIGKEIGLAVFSGVEMTFKRADTLVYGLDKAWYLAHPEMREMERQDLLTMLMEAGALVIHAHPFRIWKGIKPILLYPKCVHGVEIYNACRSDMENRLAEVYAKELGLLTFAGTDNHNAERQPMIGGMESETPIVDEKDFVRRVLAGEMRIFKMANPFYVPPAAKPQ